MKLSTLSCSGFRNFDHLELSFTPDINLVLGPNGAGKTSLLEALHVLFTGKSFRASQLNRMIQHSAQELMLVAQLVDASGKKLTIGAQKACQSTLHHRFNGENVKRKADLLSILPIQLIHHETFQLLDAGPKYRRQFLDWGVFHVEHAFLPCWQVFQKSLEQRNAALKAGQSKHQVQLWDESLIQAAVKIDAFRKDYMAALQPVLMPYLSEWLGDYPVEFDYSRGWDASVAYSEALDTSFIRDHQLKSTQLGPHRADIRITIDGIPADDVLSRGQQKQFVCALKLAQGRLLATTKHQPCLYLLDDLPAELDQARIGQLTEALTRLDAQVIITGIDEHRLGAVVEGGAGVFHVERQNVL